MSVTDEHYYSLTNTYLCINSGENNYSIHLYKNQFIPAEVCAKLTTPYYRRDWRP